MISKLKDFKTIFYVSLAFHIIAAIFSSGFQHFDEHFQIYEFLNYKLGNIPASNLPWEFHEQIRPWFQVYIYFIFHKVLGLIGIQSPFVFAFVTRLFTSLFGLFALTRLLPLIKKWFHSKESQLIAWGALNLSWFIPYIQTRTSSESFGISFFLWGLSLFLIAINENKKLLSLGFGAGILFGLSYLSRSQMSVMVATLWFWAVFFEHKKWKALVSSAVAILCIIGIGVFFDKWGYGNWTFSTWHYFRVNFLEDALSKFGTDPWYWYVRLSFNRGIPPVSLPIMLVTFWGWWKFRKHPLTWATAPMFFFHSAIGHKELRFIFPVIVLAPLYLGFFYEFYKEKIVSLWEKKSFRGLIKFIIGVNFLFLVIASFRAANPSVNFYSYVWNNDVKNITVVGENPFTMLGLPLEFYKKKVVSINVVKEYSPNIKGHLFFNRGRFVFEMEKNSNCKLQYLTYPKWVLNFNVGNWISRSRVWSLYQCE